MANFFDDILQKLKGVGELVSATTKAGEAAAQARDVEAKLKTRTATKPAITSGGFFSDIKERLGAPQELEEVKPEVLKRTSLLNPVENIVPAVQKTLNLPADLAEEKASQSDIPGIRKSAPAIGLAVGMLTPFPGDEEASTGRLLSKGEKATTKAFDAESYVKSLVSERAAAKTEPPSGIVSKVQGLLKIAKSKLVDFASPIEDTLSAAQKEHKFSLLPEADITHQIDRTLRAPTLAGQFMKDNGMEAVIRNVDNLDNLEQYMIAKHAQTVEARGIKTGRDLEKDRQLIAEFGPKYEPFAAQVSAYSRKLLDYSAESGLISKETAAMLKERYPDYVPLNRVMEEIDKAGGISGGVASLSRQTVVRALKGSEREIESPIASLLAKTNDAFVQGEKNKTARLLTSYEKLPGNPFQLRKLNPNESVGAKDTVSFFNNGVKEVWQTTPEIANAAKSLNVQQLNILGKILALPVRLAKIGITGINLPFVGANVARDQLFAAITSKEALKTSLANPVVFLESLFSAVKHNALYDDLVRAGAGGTSFDIARNQAPQTIERIRSTASTASRIAYIAKNPSELLRAVENVIGRSEELTRLQQFKGTRDAFVKRGYSVEEATIEAAKAARENTANFYRRGEWGTVLNSAFLYLNASIQGSRAFLGALERDPLGTSAKVATVLFLPMATATAWNLADEKRKEAYLDIPEYEKEGNLIIVPPNPSKDEKGRWNVIKVPLPPGVGSLTIPVRRGLEQAHGLDPLRFGEVASALIGSVSPINPDKGSVLSTVTPQAIKPTLEAATNRNFFTGLPQVPQSMEALSPDLQARPYTSGTARKIGGVFDVSPIKIEEFIKGTTGGVGSQILNAVDRVLAGLDVIPKEQIGGQNVVDAIAARFTKARGGESERRTGEDLKVILRDQADDRFRLKQEAEIVYGELKALPKDEANAKAKELKAKNPQLFEKLKDTVKEAEKGLDYNDRLMIQMGVENGVRAKFIWKALEALQTKEEKNAYVSDLKKKGIVSPAVMDQLRKMKSGN